MPLTTPNPDPHASHSRSDRWITLGAIAGLLALLAFFIARGLARSFTPDRGTDFEHFFGAAQAMLSGTSLYASHKGQYIYPPLVAWLLTPLAHLTVQQALRVWLVSNLVITAGSIALLSREMARRVGVRFDLTLLLVVSLLTLLANFDQIRWEFELGQSDTLVLLGFALGLVWLDKRPWLAGLALGVAFNVKYQTLVTLPYLLVRRRFAAAASMMACSVALLLLPAVTHGWRANLGSVQVAFAGMLNHVGLGPGQDVSKAANVYPVDFFRSVSITSAVARLTDGVNHRGTLIAVTGVIALGLLGAGWALYKREGVPLLLGRDAKTDSEPTMLGVTACEWVGLIVVALALSPHTLSRHTFLMIPVHVLAFTLLCRPRKGVPMWPLLIGTVAFSLGVMLPFGGGRSEAALNCWRYYGGTSWCMLLFYFTLVWTVLRYRRTAGEG